MIKTISQAIDDIAVSLGAAPSAEIPTVAQALENVYTALGGTRTDLDTLVVSEVIDLVAPLIQGGGGGGGGNPIVVHMSADGTLDKTWNEIFASFPHVTLIDPQESESSVVMVGVPASPEDVYKVTDNYYSYYVTASADGYPKLTD